MNWYLAALKKYATFSGRSRRKEYWMFALFNGIFSVVAIMIDTLLGTSIDYGSYGIVSILFGLAMIVPGLSVTVRRLHDIDKNWIWLFISLIPIIGQIWFIILLCKDSNSNENEYGVNPKIST